MWLHEVFQHWELNSDMPDEKEDKKSKLDGWAAITTAVLTGTAALITAIGFPQFFPSLVQKIASQSSTTENAQSQNKLNEMAKVGFNVYESDYKPIEQVEVRFIFNGAPVSKYTDSNGYVDIEIPKRQDIEVILNKADFQSKRQIFNLQADPSKPFLIQLKRVNIEETTNENPFSSQQPSTSLGLKQMMPYDEARKILIDQGWQAQIPASRGLFSDLNNPSVKYLFSEKGYQEVISCLGTGLGTCRLHFKNEEGKTLVVITANNQPGQEVVVYKWFFE